MAVRRNVTRTTNDQGRAVVSFLTTLSGTYTFTVTSASRAGWIYNPAANGPTTASVTIP
jgi:hypothetical protein